MRINPVIFGCEGTQLSEREAAFFREIKPWGYILFARNIDNPDQVRRLVDDLKTAAGHDDVAVLIDQEGGRVRRLRPTHWPDYHSGRTIGLRYKHNSDQGRRMAWVQSRLMAFDLAKLGINVDCLPVLDVPVDGSHDVIGDRAYCDKYWVVADIGKAACAGLLAGGVLPVVKHIPGHGRANVDSHHDLPVVDADFETLNGSDFAAFKKLADMPLAMTAHVVYSAIDPIAPATTSAKVIDEIIRQEIGFDGLLMCDDLSMHALSGDLSERTQSAFAAGCDVVLHCNGVMEQMQAVASSLQPFSSEALTRAEKAAAHWHNGKSDDEQALREEFEAFSISIDEQRDPTEYTS